MSEQQHAAASDPPDDRPEESTPRAAPPSGQQDGTGEPGDTTHGPDQPGTTEDPAGPLPEAEATHQQRAAGRRVTTRRVDRREVTEHTQETITEDIPLDAYQGPGSAHPAPVG